MNLYKRTLWLGIMGLLISQLNAKTVYPIEVAPNPSSEQSAQTKSASRYAPKTRLSAKEITTILHNSPDYKKMDPRIRRWIDSNKGHYLHMMDNTILLYYDKEAGIEVQMSIYDKQNPNIFVEMVAVNRPESMAYDMARTRPVHPETNRPYFEITEEQLQTLEEETQMCLTPAEKGLLQDILTILNENFHYFYGESFVNLEKVVPDKDKSLLIGTYIPPREFIDNSFENIIPTKEVEEAQLWLSLIEGMPADKQKDAHLNLMHLPADPVLRETLLSDTERWLTEFGTPESNKPLMAKLIPALRKVKIGSPQERALMAQLYPVMMKSRFGYELLGRYIQLPENKEALFERYAQEVPDKKRVEKVRADLNRLDEMYENKLKLGKILWRPVYHNWQIADYISGGTANCFDHGTTSLVSKAGYRRYIKTFNQTNANRIELNLFEKSQQVYLFIPAMEATQTGLRQIAAENNVNLSDNSKNKTPFAKAIYMIDQQLSSVIEQVRHHPYMQTAVKGDARFTASETRLSDSLPIQFGQHQQPIQKQKAKIPVKKQKQKHR